MWISGKVSRQQKFICQFIPVKFQFISTHGFLVFPSTSPTLPSSSPSSPLVLFLLSGKLQADPDPPPQPRPKPHQSPFSPCPSQSTSPGTRQAARWASLAVWTGDLVSEEECAQCK